MLKSMTAFGRAEGELSHGLLTIEIKSVNHRYLDISLRLPKKYNLLEERIKKKMVAQFSRGRIDLSFQVNSETSKLRNLELDMELASAYYKILEQLQKSFDLQGTIDLSLMASFKDLIWLKEDETDIEKEWGTIEAILNQAMNSMEQMRVEEGKALRDDLIKRLDLLYTLVNVIKAYMPKVIGQYNDKLRQRIRALLEDIQVDEIRIAQEVAIMADRSDVTEELVRMKSHIDQFKILMDTAEPVGRRLDFLIQEMYREANTIGSKVGNASISHKVVDIKFELEKMREQVQNIE